MWHIWTEGTIIPATSNRRHPRNSVIAAPADGQSDGRPPGRCPVAMVRQGMVVALMALFLGCDAGTGEGGHSAESGQAAALVLELAQGRVQGIASPFTASNGEHITVYRGLPYAAPPVGDNRWRPPGPPPSWDGVLLADTFSDSCYQARHSSSFVWRREDFPVSEDCLYLNVWAPADGANLPVMVWFHGGAHTSGQGHSLIFDGTELASQGIILITINYRLGPFGFLAHPLLAAESDHNSAGNYGLMDKIVALEWVRANAGAFGGDADNVTIFGQSAGSQSVCALMASPRARGLFHKAIGQSAACVNTMPEQDANGYARGARLLDTLAVDSMAAARSLDPETVVSASQSSGWEAESRLTVDGWLLEELPRETFRAGRQAPVPLMLGFLANEGIELFPSNPMLTEDELHTFLTGVAGESGAPLLRQHYIEEHPVPGDLQHAVATDFFMAFGMRRWAEFQSAINQPTFFYFMDHVPPAFHLYMPEQPMLTLAGGPRSGGAYHSGDLALVFGSTDKVGLDWNPADRVVSDYMVRYWSTFARTGTPNGDQLPPWPAFDGSQFWTLVLNESPAAQPGVRTAVLDIMATQWPL